jgi:hypothetical protein
MKSKQLLITVYFETDQNDLVLDHNNDEGYDYDYEKCITKVIADHLKSVNSDVLIVDVAMDTTTDRIKELVNKENK